MSSTAELGVVFLLFLIGLELSFERLLIMRRLVFGLGGLQVVVTMAVLTLSLFVLGRGYGGRPGRISRLDGTLLLLAYIAYTGYLMVEVFTA